MGERVAAAVAYGDHGSTYGGNLLACRAALVFLEELIDRGLLGHVAKSGALAHQQLQELAKRHTSIIDIRGEGMMWGIEVDGNTDASAIVTAALKRCLLINRTAGSVIRLLPPLTITEDELSTALTTLEAAFAEAEARAS